LFPESAAHANIEEHGSSKEAKVETTRLDRIDRAILTILEEEGRLSYAELGERVGLSKSPCWKRVQALEEAGIIRGYGASIDHDRLGATTLAFAHISIAFEKHEAFERAVMGHPCVLDCYATVGEADYVLRLLTRDLAALDAFLRHELWRLPGVRRFTTTLTMRTIKSGGSVMAGLA
jgi:Lrp/AsnC family transcriptional regulator, leucine-responsive regulatory protein